MPKHYINLRLNGSAPMGGAHLAAFFPCILLLSCVCFCVFCFLFVCVPFVCVFVSFFLPYSPSPSKEEVSMG